MSLKKHPNYVEEKERLDYTIKYVEDSILATEENRKRLKAETREAYMELDFLDTSLSYVKIMTNSRFLDVLEKNYGGLLRARKKPYFCRIDFKHDDSDKVSKLYIGKMSLSNVEDDVPIIVDWRSPVASVYYDGKLGHVTYETPTGTSGGELYLKRQYTIENAQLQNILDVDITTTDTFLQAALGENKDNKLKDIVSTIQSEQNEIIRADIGLPLIVQGVAGSGKTTIALHRIAYLIYTYEERFDPEDFLIIAPNKLFLNYISEVLPELGVEKVKQTTFIDLVYELLGIKFDIRSTEEKLIKFISKNSKTTKNKIKLIQQVSQFKGSLKFKEMIDNYVSFIEEDFVPNYDFKLDEHVLFTEKEIRKMFLQDFSYLPLHKRILEIKKVLSNKLKREKVSIIKQTENYYDKKIERIRNSEMDKEEARQNVVELIDTRDLKVGNLKKMSKTLITKYIALFPKHDIIYYYKELCGNRTNFEQFYNGDLDSNFIKYFCESFHLMLGEKKFEIEDLAGLIYLKHLVFGLDKKTTIKYIVIDEAQDFSLFQLYALKTIFKTDLFTILGDIAQGIHSYKGINNWEDVLKEVFKDTNTKYLALQQSYRTTIEIMDLANEVLKMSNIKGLVQANPVVRHGDKPQIYRFDKQKEMIKAIEDKIYQLQGAKYSTIALICKTSEECSKIKKLLDKNIKTKQLRGDDKNYEGGAIIVPSYLSKGLEFDAVIIVSLDEDYGQEDLDLKLLYVAMTRALHSMDVMCISKNLNILENIK